MLHRVPCRWNRRAERSALSGGTAIRDNTYPHARADRRTRESPTRSSLQTSRRRRPANGDVWCARSRSASAAPTARSSPANTARRRPGPERLILGHELLGRVEEAPQGSGFARGDLVVGIVRRPDPVPCAACAVGEWDMCRNGLYTERGIKERNGYGAEQFRIERDFAVKLDPALGLLGVLLEPASVVAKAWEHVERIGRRSRSWQPRVALITGAGPVGLLAALLGAQRGLEVHILDRNTRRAEAGLGARARRHLS